MSDANFGRGIYQLELARRIARWLDLPPHPDLVCEIAPDHVATACWKRNHLEGAAGEPLPPGALAPSPIETNVANPEALTRALRHVLERVPASGRQAALLVPDAVVRVFLLPFETFPRRAAEAVPLLRWRLKKSIPYDVEETVVSWMCQPSRESGVEVVTAVARQRIIREYEQAAEAAGLAPGVVLGSTLAALPLVEDGRVTLVARMNGLTLTTTILAGGRLTVYRSSDMASEASAIAATELLGEIYPAVAYYQDTAHENVEQLRLAGFSGRFEELREAISTELGCPVAPLGVWPGWDERLPAEARNLLHQDWEALVGWALNRGL